MLNGGQSLVTILADIDIIIILTNRNENINERGKEDFRNPFLTARDAKFSKCSYQHQPCWNFVDLPLPTLVQFVMNMCDI